MEATSILATVLWTYRDNAGLTLQQLSKQSGIAKCFSTPRLGSAQETWTLIRVAGNGRYDNPAACGGVSRPTEEAAKTSLQIYAHAANPFIATFPVARSIVPIAQH